MIDDDHPHGDICERCGLSEAGAARIIRIFGKVKPCPWCPASVKAVAS